jgi:uncharacterized protein (TIGR02448 family)
MVASSDRNGSMDSWKTLAIAVMALIDNLAAAAEKTNPFDQMPMYITFVPSTLFAGTASLTTESPTVCKSAKTDALAFIESDGEIRGAQFERAPQHYWTCHRCLQSSTPMSSTSAYQCPI